jgi:hypothetical protein
MKQAHGVWRGWDSVVGMANTLRAGRSVDRVPVGDEIFRALPDR